MKNLIEEEEEMCPVCKSTKYLNPKLTLLVSPCYHRLCETCINRLFLHGSAPCPLCGTILRKGNFVVATFDDLIVEKEVRIRKIVSKAFYKRAEDFDTLKGYNDYLEEVEDIVFNLANDVDVQSTYARLESFKTENRHVLEKNLARLANEQRHALIEEEAEQHRREKMKIEANSELEKEKIEIIQMKQKFINDLANSSAPAAVILAEAQKNIKSKGASQTAAPSRTLRPLKISSVSTTSFTNDHSTTLSRRSNRRPATQSDTDQFDPLKNIIPVTTRLPLKLAELDIIPSEIVLDLFADYFPPAPSSYRDKVWNIEKQMKAAGYSLDIIKRHCVKAAFSWGL